MEDKKLALESYHLILKDFKLVDDVEINDFTQLEEFLTKRVRYFLDNDFNNLLNALYRIDISEKLLNRLLHTSPVEDLSRLIAKAIIEREKQKVLTRERYRQN